MFGTVARIMVQPGKEQELAELSAQWTSERGPSSGQVAEYVFKSEGQPGEFFVVAIFSDRETYYANPADPETDRWYRRMRAMLQSDPEWHDGEIVQTTTLSGI